MTDPPHRHSHYPQPTPLTHQPSPTPHLSLSRPPSDHPSPHSHEACRPYDLKVGSVIERDQSHLEEFEVRTTPHTTLPHSYRNILYAFNPSMHLLKHS